MRSTHDDWHYSYNPELLKTFRPMLRICDSSLFQVPQLLIHYIILRIDSSRAFGKSFRLDLRVCVLTDCHCFCMIGRRREQRRALHHSANWTCSPLRRTELALHQ